MVTMLLSVLGAIVLMILTIFFKGITAMLDAMGNMFLYVVGAVIGLTVFFAFLLTISVISVGVDLVNAIADFIGVIISIVFVVGFLWFLYQFFDYLLDDIFSFIYDFFYNIGDWCEKKLVRLIEIIHKKVTLV